VGPQHLRTIPCSKAPYLLIPTRSLFILFEMINDDGRGTWVEKRDEMVD
jgi:hypothetical protein